MIKLSGNLELVGLTHAWRVALAKDAFLDILNAKVKSGISTLLANTRTEIWKRITTSEVFVELLGRGRLLGFVGEGDIESKLNTLVQRLCDSVNVTFKQFTARGSFVAGGLRLVAIPADYSDILPLGDLQPDWNWLSALLLSGSSPVARDFSVRFAPEHLPQHVADLGRTKQALTLPKKGSVVVVPTEFQGTATDNFITRAIESMGSDFLEREFISLLQ